jgi:hypothetical protein
MTQRFGVITHQAEANGLTGRSAGF